MRLDPDKHDWMTAPDVSRIFAALPEGTLRFVGGCVRNSLMGIPIGDIDMATQLEPKSVKAALDAAGIKNIPTGIEHGTITAVVSGEPYEITSLRKDVETDGRRAVVAFTTDWAEDAIRRDLTMNALYTDQTGQVFDPTGEGLDDLKNKRFRFVGDADARVREDYLRILRFFRFIAFYGGDGVIDAQALKACRENRDGIKSLSSERIWAEVKKLLSAPDPSRAVRIMATNEILETTLPEASNSEGLSLMVALENREGLTPDPLLRLMAMSARDELGMARLCQRLKMSKAEKERLMGWAGNRVGFTPDMDERTLKIGTYASTPQTAFDRMAVRAAGAEDPIVAHVWMDKARWALAWDIPTFPLKGRDLSEAGVPNGPEMGAKLRALNELWVRSGFNADKEKLLAALNLLG